MFNNWKLRSHISDDLMPGILRFRPDLMNIRPEEVECRWPNFIQVSYSEKLKLISTTLCDNLKKSSRSLPTRQSHVLKNSLECDSCLSSTGELRHGWKTLFGTGESGDFLSICPICFDNEIETGTLLDNGKFLVDYVLDSENALTNFLDPPKDFPLDNGSNPKEVSECSPESSKFSLQLVETSTANPQGCDPDETIQAVLNSNDEIELPDEIESVASEPPILSTVANLASFDDYEEPNISVQQQYDSEDQDPSAKSLDEFLDQDYDSEKQKIIDDESFSAVDLEDDLPTQDPYYHGKPNTALAKELASLDPIAEDLPKKRNASHSASPVSVPQPPKRKRVDFKQREPAREVSSEIKLLTEQIVKDPKTEPFLALNEESEYKRATEFSVSAKDFRFTIVRSPYLTGITSTEFSRMIHDTSSGDLNTVQINKLLVYSIFLCKEEYYLSSRDEALWELLEKLEDTQKTNHIESLMKSFICSAKIPFTQNLENIILAFACSTYVNLWKSENPEITNIKDCNRIAKKRLSTAITDQNTKIRLSGSTIAKFRAVENFLYTNTCAVSLLLCLPQMQLVNILRVLYRYQSKNKPEITLVSLLQEKTFNIRFDKQWRLSKTLLDRNWCHRW